MDVDQNWPSVTLAGLWPGGVSVGLIRSITLQLREDCELRRVALRQKCLLFVKQRTTETDSAMTLPMRIFSARPLTLLVKESLLAKPQTPVTDSCRNRQCTHQTSVTHHCDTHPPPMPAPAQHLTSETGLTNPHNSGLSVLNYHVEPYLHYNSFNHDLLNQPGPSNSEHLLPVPPYH